MKFYNMDRPLYLEMYVSGISLGAWLLQWRDGMNCGYDKIPDNATLHLIASGSQNLSREQQHYSNIEHEAPWILHMPEKFHQYCSWGMYVSSLTISH